jgi:putative ABC transport system permease protein
VNRFWINVAAALRSLREQRGRAGLSAVGIAIASLAIVVLVSIAIGVQRDVKAEVDDLGANLLVVLPGRIEQDSLLNPGILGISRLSMQDVESVRRIEGILRASPLTFVGAGARVGEKTNAQALIIAVEPVWFQIRLTEPAEGALFDESNDLQPVCVLGSIAKERLLGEAPAVGKTLEYGGRDYAIVGVTAKRRQSSSLLSFGSFENAIFVPFAFTRSTSPQAQIDRIILQSDPRREPKALVAAVESELAKRLPHETYSVLTQEDLLRLVFKVMGILTWLLTGITSIALFVGGVGIMTVMLMSVGERTKEIGIRKTVGARRFDVFVQFLLEAVLLALTGSLAGLALSAVICGGLATWTPLRPEITTQTVLLSLSVCLVVGAVFGLAPAMRAASKDPVQSLRHE